jgi:hypothetical protein
MNTAKFHPNKIVLNTNEEKPIEFRLYKFPTIQLGLEYINHKGEVYIRQ